MSYDIAKTAFRFLQSYDGDYQNENPLLNRLLLFMDSTMNAQIINGEKEEKLYKLTKRLIEHTKLCAYVDYYKQSNSSKALLNKNLDLIKKYVFESLKNPNKIVSENFFEAIALLVESKYFKKQETEAIISYLNPFSGRESFKKFNRIFPAEQKINCGKNQYLKHKGGYQLMSYLFIANYDFRLNIHLTKIG